MSENELNENSQNEAKESVKEVQKDTTNENRVWNMISYLGILWLVTILACPNKDKKDVKFHIGQGMLITALMIVISIINNLIIANLFTTEIWFGVRTTSGFGVLLMTLLNLVVGVFAVIGIINAYNGEEKELPIIGRFSFYK